MMTIQRTLRIAITPLFAAAFALSTAGHSQQPVLTLDIPHPDQDTAAQAAKQQAEIAFLHANGPEGEGQEARQKIVLDLVTARNPVVKGKPYAAETSTETVQTLADGNRIVNRSVSKFYRDSQGRTRREQTFGNVDPSNPSPHEVKIFIDDPVANSAYVLDPGDKSARLTSHSDKFLAERDSGSHEPHLMVKVVNQHAPLDAATLGSVPDVLDLPKLDEGHDIVKEDLGKRTIEGVECTGTQQTITIPANQVGNERPIAIVTETWFSPAIQAVVQSTTNDPRFGQTTYQLRNLQVAEQQQQLFAPPSDYHVEQPRR
jgi:hypothetical protein